MHSLLEYYRHHFPDFDINTTLLLCNIAEIRQRIAIKYQSWEEVELAIRDLSQVSIFKTIFCQVGTSLACLDGGISSKETMSSSLPITISYSHSLL